jgi:hypothetical protein
MAVILLKCIEFAKKSFRVFSSHKREESDIAYWCLYICTKMLDELLNEYKDILQEAGVPTAST